MDAFDQSDAAGTDQHLPDDLPASPFPLLLSWFQEAAARKIQANPNAMTLATATADGRPSARVVLCKAIDCDAGFVVFYTNYRGRKGEELAANPRAAGVFFWDALDRQVRIEGPVIKSPDAESDAYFASRPLASKLGAWSSEQSRPIRSREAMAERVASTMQQFNVDLAALATGADRPVPRPAHWGGYRIFADRVELWVSGAGRVHDRAAWTRELTPDEQDGFRPGPWSSTRLQP